MYQQVELMNNAQRNFGLEFAWCQFRRYFYELVVITAFTSGMAYFAVRFVSRDQLFASTLLNVLVPVGLLTISTVVFAAWAYKYFRRQTKGAFHPLARIFLAGAAFLLLLLFCSAASKHFTAGLASLADINRPDGTINLWDARGVCRTKPSYRLEELHRKGDEVAHLTAAQAVRVTFGRPSAIGKLCREDTDTPWRYDRRYWIERSLRGHPPGLAIIYSLVCDNPVFARVFALTLTILAGVLAFFAGNKIAPKSGLGLGFVAFFAGVPNLIWWHAASVSSDIAPCLFTFGSVLVLVYLYSLSNLECGVSWSNVIIAAFLLALGTFTTYTAALPAGATTLLIVSTTRCQHRTAKAATVLLASGIAVGLGMMYSRAIFGDDGHVLLSRAQALLDGDSQGPFISGLRAAKVFMSRMPMDLGLPLVTTFLGCVIACFLSELSFLQKMVRLGAALIILVPSAMLFWPEIRFAYPGWLLVCWGIGVPQFWNRLTPLGRAGLVGTLLGFSYTKFVLLRLAVPV